ncbi:MAG: tetratricopeptide repeat protein [Phycisphaerales bacterium]|nr:tetratricopeptide repeat protein [Phycisphaerales bacterium]
MTPHSDLGGPNESSNLFADTVRDFERMKQAEAAWVEHQRQMAAPAFEPHTKPIPGITILRRIDHGGQGVVYEAQQEVPSRRVAIKVLRAGRATDPIQRALFNQEIETLGRLNHPGIVAVHGGGTCDGHAYFVMDFVAGTRLDAYVHERSLNVRHTLHLFARTCEIVAAAHVSGIIHGDLKPQNILVDEQGAPHILDFGLSRLCESGAQVAGGADGDFCGTLPYAAPEQLDAALGPVGTRSDVCSLGVILFEMLAGHSPWGDWRTRRELTERILAAEPPVISRAAAKQHGEINAIIRKCLSKRAADRYDTAGALHNEILRLLSGDAIDALRDRRLYVLRKTVRKNLAAFGLVACLIVVLLFGIGVSLWQYGRAEQARVLAELREAEFRKVSGFLAEMLRDFDVSVMGNDIVRAWREHIRIALENESIGTWPDRRKRTSAQVDLLLQAYDSATGVAKPADVAREILSKHLLDRASTVLDRNFRNQPFAASQLNEALSASYQSIGKYELAESRIRAAIEYGQALPESSPADQATVLSRLGAILHDKGQPAEAVEFLQKAVGLLRKSVGEDDPRYATALNDLAQAQSLKGDPAAVESMLREALAIRRRALGDEHEDVAVSLNNLAQALQRMRRFDEAEPLYRESISLRTRLFGENDVRDVRVARTHSNLGLLKKEQRRFDEAETLLRKALGVYRERLGDNHPDTTSVKNNLGDVLFVKGDIDAAAELFEDALRTRRIVLGDKHPETWASMQWVAAIRMQRGDLSGAEDLYRECLSFVRSGPDQQHEFSLHLLNNLASVLNRTKQFAEAETIFRELLPLCEARFSPDDPRTAQARFGLGIVISEQKRFAEAEPLLIAAFDVLSDRPQAPTTIRGRMLNDLIKFYEKWHAVDPAGGHDAQATKLRKDRDEKTPASDAER